MMPKSLTLPATARQFGHFINGSVVPVGNRDTLIRTSPAHDRPVTIMPICTPEDLDAAVMSARVAFEDRCWSGLGGAERASTLLRAATILRRRVNDIAYWEVLENGKPISQARAEIQGCIGMLEYASGLARSLHGDAFNNLGDTMLGLVTREPVGVVGIITPWNFPFLILCERVPYILASGNCIVAKPSEFTSATSLLLAEILTEAGLPDGVFNVVTGTGDTIGQAMSHHMDIDMLSFTGSTAVGRQIVQAAGQSNFKKLSLELGGKNPQIVFADASLGDAADGVAFGIGFNAGQCCVSGSRLIVERSVAKKFGQMVANKLMKAVIGDPLNDSTQIGAITTDSQYQAIMHYIETGQSEGAHLVCGGDVPRQSRGRYINPTIFTDVTPEMTIMREEIFGPVLSVIPFETIEEAIAIANATDYGLAASVWTQNLDTALQVTRRVRAGRFWVNTTLAGGPEMPIGGFKQSGWGREAGTYGVEEYTQIKSVHIDIGQRAHWIS